MLSTLLVAALSSVAVAAPISKIGTVTPSLLPNATQYNTSVVYYEMNGNYGACGNKNEDSDKVVGLPLEFYSKLNEVSQYCGEYVVVTNTKQNISVTAQVADASTQNNTLSVSVATWKALNGSDANLHYVDWRRANETEIAAAKKAQSSSAPAAPTSTWVAPSSSSAPVTSSSSEKKAAWTPSSSSEAAKWTPSSSAEESKWTPSSSAQESKWTPSSSAKESKWTPSSSSEEAKWTPSSSSEAPKWTPSSSSEEPKWTPSSSSEEPKWTPSSSTSTWSSPAAKWTPTSTWTPEPTTTTQAPKKTQEASTSSFSGSYSGQATFYTQGGVAGSCGDVNGDYSPIVAMNIAQVSGGKYCGQWVKIKNTANGKEVTAKVADTCPGCSYGSLDLSLGAFSSIGEYDTGVLPITWSFI